jgi:hypothetical protein
MPKSLLIHDKIRSWHPNVSQYIASFIKKRTDMRQEVENNEDTSVWILDFNTTILLEEPGLPGEVVDPRTGAGHI